VNKLIMILIAVLIILFLPFISYERDHMNGVVTVENKNLFTLLKDNYIKYNITSKVETKDLKPIDTGELNNEKK
jgi:hypothetical protein